MWRPRDRERFIGSYDPEHEMPDPDRGGGDRWQSDAYRHNARDTRFLYRMDPDRFESRYDGPRRDVSHDSGTRWTRDARDFDRGYDRDPGRDYGRDYGRADFDRSFDRGMYGGGSHYGDGGRYESDRGYDPYRDGGGYGREHETYGGGRNASNWDRERERGGYASGSQFDRDRNYGSDRGWDRDRYDRGVSSGNYGSDRWEGDRNWRRR
ncbi:MAG TPA: hypothetical protein VHW00_20205 [Thermoanaerobaculia bacterium]|nr:hypothetical protein [Thermoanaerobaculia bacterium]